MGLEIIRAVQGWSTPALDLFFVGVTMLGSEELFLVIVSLVYWLGDRRLGLTLGVLFCLSALSNQMLKDLFRQPRPSPAEVRVLFAASGEGYGFPSGHTQNGTVFWGALARHRGGGWWVLVAVVVGMIGLSRLYLGLHWPVDVLGGAGIGVALLWAYSRLENPGREGPVLGILLGVAVLVCLTYRTPVAAKVGGGLAGMLVGYRLEASVAGLRPPVGWRALARALLGLGVLGGFQVVGGRWLPEAYGWTLVRYLALGFAGFGLLPRLFRYLGC
ncbi:MAG: phosphatase PAP2 family protein [Moorellales bacterium]